MDPVTIFSTVGTAIALSQTCLDITNFLGHIHTSYKESNNTLRSIETECDVFYNSAKLIKQWLESQEDKASSELQLQLLNVGKALILINESMKDLGATLHRITEKSTANRPITGYNWSLNGSLGDTWLKAKFVFNEEALKGNMAELREHGGLLQLTLTTLQVCGTGAPERSAASFQHVAAQALAIRRAHTMRRKPQEEQGSHLAKVMTTNLSPTSQDQSSATPSAYDEFLAIHDTNKNSDLLRRSDTSPSPESRLDSANGQGPAPTIIHSVSPLGSGQLQQTSHSASQSVPDLVPTETFGATIKSLRWDAWDVPELSAEPSREETESAPSPPEGFNNHTARDEIRPSPSTVEIAPPSMTGPTIRDKATQSPSTGDSSTHHPQYKDLIPGLADSISNVSLLTASSADTAPSSRDPSLFSQGSSVPTADSIFTSSSIHSDARDAPLPAVPLSSAYSIRRKPLGFVESHSSLPPSTTTSLQQDPTQRNAAAGSVARFPTPMQSVQEWGGPFLRHLNSSSGTETDLQLDKTADLNASSAEVLVLNASDFDINKPGPDGSPLLVRAASDGLGDIVEKLLASGADIEAVHTKTKRNALIEASVQGHSRIVDLLLDHCCSLQHLDSQQMSALHHVAQKGHLLVAKALLDRGAAVDIQGSNGLSPLHLASWASHANMVMLLLQRHANVNARDASQQTALHVAASRGFPNVCNSLLDHGAQSESRDGNSKTPMQLAIVAEHREVVDLLLARSTLRPTDTNFLTAFFGAIETGHVRMVEGFFDRGATLKGLKNDAYKPVTLAAKSGNPDMVTLLLRHKAKFKEKDGDGWTALHFAAHHGHALIIEQLSDREISSKATTAKKETPLHIAVAAGHFGAIDCLLRGKSESCVAFKDSRGEEPLHRASRTASTDIFNLLFSHKANINAENGFGWKPLHIAVAYGNMAIVEQLVNLGASIEEKLGTTDYKKAETHSLVDNGYWAEAHWPFPGSKPLHLAIELGRDDVVRFLLSKGAKVDSPCAEGWRPLHLAAFNASPATVDLLLQRKAYPHAVTDFTRSRTPLDLARHRSQSQTLARITPAEADQLQVQELLHAAMASVPKRKQENWKQMKVITGKGPDDKIETLRAAAVAMELTGKGPTSARHTSIPRHGSLKQ